MRGLKVGDKVRILKCPPKPDYQFKVGEILTISKVYENEERYFYGFTRRGAIRGSLVTRFVSENRIGGEVVYE